jgi:hypothetical protein
METVEASTGSSSSSSAHERPVWNRETESLLHSWHLRVTTAQYGHQALADRNRQHSLLLGIPVVCVSTIVGTSVFAAIDRSSGGAARWVIGGLSVLAAILAGLQTLLGYSQFAERHRVAAARYAALRRGIELMLARRDSSNLDRVRTELDKTGAAAPQIGEKQWARCEHRARREIGHSPSHDPHGEPTIVHDDHEGAIGASLSSTQSRVTKSQKASPA